MQIDYTAKRSIQAGHTASTSYQINIGMKVDDHINMPKLKQHVALNGNTVTVLHDVERVGKSLQTVLVGTATTPDIDDMDEFLDSVKGGETFQLDSVNYVLDNPNTAYTKTRVADKFYQYSFRARKL